MDKCDLMKTALRQNQGFITPTSAFLRLLCGITSKLGKILFKYFSKLPLIYLLLFANFNIKNVENLVFHRRRRHALFVG